MTPHSLSQTVERYEIAIAALEAAGQQISAEQVLEALVAREQVHAALSQAPASFKGLIAKLRANFLHRKPASNQRRLLKLVAQLDRRLGRQSAFINQAIKLEDWQVLLHPPERNWLGLLNPPQPVAWRDRFDWFWQGVTLASLTVSLSLLADIAKRFLEGGPDAVGAFAIIVPSVLGLLSGGGALTKTGKEAMEHVLTSLRIAKHWWDEINCLFSIGLMGLLLVFWLGLPQVSIQYEAAADAAYQDGQLATAETGYQRALRLNPSHLEVHYKLGKLYEDLRDVDRAIAEYQIAVKGAKQGEAYKAFDRLARLYILKGGAENNSKAVSLLNEGLGLAQARKDQEAVYAIYKNLGWARLHQQRYREAIDLLERAINLYPQRAPAYCLKALAEEGWKDQPTANAAWEQCLQYANQKDPDEDLWIGMALQRLEVENQKTENQKTESQKTESEKK